MLTRGPEENLPCHRRDTLDSNGTCTEIIRLFRGLDQKETLEAVTLSCGVIHSRIDDMSFNILKQVFEDKAASSVPTEGFSCLPHCWCAGNTKESLLSEWLLQTIKTVDTLEAVKRVFAKYNFAWEEKLHSLPRWTSCKADFIGTW